MVDLRNKADVCARACVCVCKRSRDVSDLFFLPFFPLGRVIVIHALLKTTVYWDQHEHTHTRLCLYKDFAITSIHF